MITTSSAYSIFAPAFFILTFAGVVPATIAVVVVVKPRWINASHQVQSSKVVARFLA
jgi:hypothetical protein